MTISIPGIPTPISAIKQSRHFANTVSDDKKSDFLSLVATGNDTATDASRVVEGKLVGMLLGNLMQILLPTDADGLTGQSLSNDYWKSLLADAIANSLAKSGKIDIQINRQ